MQKYSECIELVMVERSNGRMHRIRRRRVERIKSVTPVECNERARAATTAAAAAFSTAKPMR